MAQQFPMGVEVRSVWVVRHPVTGCYLGRSGGWVRRLNEAAYFTTRKVGRLAVERHQAKHGSRLTVRASAKETIGVRTPATVAA